MLDLEGEGKQEGGKMCGNVYVHEGERSVSCGDGENGGIKVE